MQRENFVEQLHEGKKLRNTRRRTFATRTAPRNLTVRGRELDC
jgi:hypothetical protein